MRVVRVVVLIIVVLAAAYGVLALVVKPRPRSAYLDALPKGVTVLAHQGGDGLWPGDTLYAFQHAAALGADVLELDIHETADGRIVVIHDDTVDRTTNGSGAVADMTLAQLQALDAGYRWSPDGGTTFPYRGQGIRIPTLKAVFDAFPGKPINIEIKPDSARVAADLCRLIRANDRQHTVMVVSFHPGAIRAFRSDCPEVATAGDPTEIKIFYVLARAHLAHLFTPDTDALQVPEAQGGLRVVTPHFVRAAHDRGMLVHVWTIDETADMRRLIDMGVDGIITDRPDRLLALLGRPHDVTLAPGVAP
ncbi:MAG: glycerophosphodiester phosphodiesterase [Deinococcales bacterium]|jgi:glycerophosphoryl diester phosphodiesterase